MNMDIEHGIEALQLLNSEETQLPNPECGFCMITCWFSDH